MVCSLALPLLHLGSERLSGRGRFMLLLGLIVLACLGKWFLLFGNTRAEAILDGSVLKYFFLFYLGYLLPEGGPMLWSRFQKRRAWNMVLLLAAVWFFLIPPDELRIGQGICAWLILGSLLYGTELHAYRALDHPVAVFHGSISYSFYLLHALVLVAVTRFAAFALPKPIWEPNPILSMLVLWVVSSALTTPLAYLLCVGVEKPFIRVSKRICARLVVPKKVGDGSVEPGEYREAA